MSYVTTYAPLPIAFARGEGVWLFDKAGEPYLDATSGIAVCGLGHAHPEISKIICQQAAKLMHTSNAVQIPEQEALAAKLTTLTGMKQVFFANSGAEANEAAIKLCRLYGHRHGINDPTIIVMERAFHGRTIATLTASGSRKVQAGFEPLLPGFIRVPFNDLEAIQTIAKHRENVVAVMLEPIQGEGGIYVAEDAYLQALAAFCHEKNWLLVLDEIQTGNARTGTYFAAMQAGIKADIITTAKGLGNGFPIGACLMNDRACNLFQPGNHGSTFGGNPLAAATALRVLELLEEEKIYERVVQGSALLRTKLLDHLDGHPQVRALRGRGYMLGIELDRPAKDIRMIGLDNGILLNVTAENVIRLLPPLIISEEEIEILASRLFASLKMFLKQ